MGYDDTIPEFDDGLQMLNKWFSRTDMEGREVLSCEQKESFEIPTSGGRIKFNYIIDRLDRIGEDEYEVVDYKSQRATLSFDELSNKIQAKAYALAIQIKYPNAKRIAVTFDLLRHTPVTVWFTKEDNKKTWRYLKDMAEDIVQTPENKVRATLNSECRFCPVKATCPRIKDNVNGGGTHTISTPDEAAAKIYEMQSLIKAAEQQKKEYEEFVMKYAADIGLTEWDTEDGKLSVSVGHGRGRRVILDERKLIALLPPEIVAQHTKIGVTELDKILKSGKLDRDTASKAKRLVDQSPGNLGVSIKAK
jgi:CRISPR/Cas system-associated exonuclease Cas4 (RecB family)